MTVGRIASLLNQDKPEVDVEGKLFAHGTTVPADGTAGYETGCLFQNLAGGDGTSLYVNEGSVTSCNFNAVTVAA